METLTKEEIIFEVLQATGLNWTARKEQVQTKSGLILPDVYAVTRSDNNSYLGAVGDRYEFLQNHEMIEIAYESGREVFNSELKLNHPCVNRFAMVMATERTASERLSAETVSVWLLGLT